LRRHSLDRDAWRQIEGSRVNDDPSNTLSRATQVEAGNEGGEADGIERPGTGPELSLDGGGRRS
jgi:hypothetical protein